MSLLELSVPQTHPLAFSDSQGSIKVRRTHKQKRVLADAVPSVTAVLTVYR